MDNEVCPEIRQGIFLFPITLSSFYLPSAFSFNPLFRIHIFHASRLHEIKQAHLLPHTRITLFSRIFPRYHFLWNRFQKR